MPTGWNSERDHFGALTISDLAAWCQHKLFNTRYHTTHIVYGCDCCFGFHSRNVHSYANDRRARNCTKSESLLERISQLRSRTNAQFPECLSVFHSNTRAFTSFSQWLFIYIVARCIACQSALARSENACSVRPRGNRTNTTARAAYRLPGCACVTAVVFVSAFRLDSWALLCIRTHRYEYKYCDASLAHAHHVNQTAIETSPPFFRPSRWLLWLLCYCHDYLRHGMRSAVIACIALLSIAFSVTHTADRHVLVFWMQAMHAWYKKRMRYLCEPRNCDHSSFYAAASMLPIIMSRTVLMTTCWHTLHIASDCVELLIPPSINSNFINTHEFMNESLCQLHCTCCHCISFVIFHPHREFIIWILPIRQQYFSTHVYFLSDEPKVR